MELPMLTSYDKKSRHTAYLCCTDHLSTSSFAFRSTLNDTGQIKDLDFCSAIFENSGNGC